MDIKVKYLNKFPYVKSTGISLLLHGVLIGCLAMLGPVYSIEKPAEFIAIEVELVPAVKVGAVPDVVDMVEAADSAPPAPSPPAPEKRPASKAVPLATGAPAMPAAASDVAVVNPIPAETQATGKPTTVGGNGKNVGAGTQATTNRKGGGGRISPKYLQGSRPAYPQAARKARWEGSVVVRLLIDTNGSVASVTVRQGSGYDVLDQAAVQAVKNWRFSPAKEQGVPVTSFYDARVRFSLDEAE